MNRWMNKWVKYQFFAWSSMWVSESHLMMSIWLLNGPDLNKYGTFENKVGTINFDYSLFCLSRTRLLLVSGNISHQGQPGPVLRRIYSREYHLSLDRSFPFMGFGVPATSSRPLQVLTNMLQTTIRTIPSLWLTLMSLSCHMQKRIHFSVVLWMAPLLLKEGLHPRLSFQNSKLGLPWVLGVLRPLFAPVVLLLSSQTTHRKRLLPHRDV